MPPLRTTTFVAKPANTIAEVKPVDPFFILGCVFLGAAVLFSTVAYGYGLYLESDIEKTQGKIQVIEKELEQYPLEKMLAFNTKVTMVQTLLRNHTFPETIFAALGSGVEKNVFYNSFNLSYTPGVGHNMTISAIAPDYASVARQMDSLKSTAYGSLFKSVDMVSLGKDQYGNKLFDIKVNVLGSLRKFDTPTSLQTIGTPTNNSLPSIVGATNTASTRVEVVPAPAPTINSTNTTPIEEL